MAGKVITLNVTPEAGKRLKAGSLKYNNTPVTGNSFVMPNEDVTIKAQLKISRRSYRSGLSQCPRKPRTPPAKRLTLSGMVVRATYSDGSMATVTGWTSTPANGAVLRANGPESRHDQLYGRRRDENDHVQCHGQSGGQLTAGNAKTTRAAPPRGGAALLTVRILITPLAPKRPDMRPFRFRLLFRLSRRILYQHLCKGGRTHGLLY
jgi:hypothetical protein